ncbi:MAG: AraC family transcriptional regulator [Flavobacteriales bacterium]|nr:AraC family transcriptional regulator [Flavobacteriales bacterium]
MSESAKFLTSDAKKLYLIMHFNGRFIINLAQFAAQIGGNMAELISLSGHSFQELSREDFKVDATVYNKVTEAALRMTGDELFGLHAGQNLNLQAAGLMMQITHSANTVQHALELSCEYSNLGCSAMPLSLKNWGDKFAVIMEPNPIWTAQSELAVRHTIFGYLAFKQREFESLTRFKHNIIGINLTIDKPTYYSQLEQALNCSIYYGQSKNAILLDAKHIQAKVITSDYRILQALIQIAEEKNKALENKQSLKDLVKRSVMNLMQLDFPSIEITAAHLNTSVRSLQRKLKLEHTSYMEIVDELRLEFAEKYLKDLRLSVSEVAHLLNYSDSSSFNRSFKRWKGITPVEYRSSIQ